MTKFYNDHDVPVSIWATLSDEMGYWIDVDYLMYHQISHLKEGFKV